MFPACILFGLAELLIPELARCAAAGSRNRIHYLVRRGLKITMLYGILFCGLEFLLADWLCQSLYGSLDAGRYLRLYALLIPMLYCDAITDATTKGLGQQKICVRYNILTSFLDLVFLFLLLPKYGMMGYYMSFFVTHLINFLLSLNRLMKITGRKLPLQAPILTGVAAVGGVAISMQIPSPLGRGIIYPVVLGCMLYLMQVVDRRDIVWLKSLIRKK
jgi:O-antigen/teichoic acid export membrane protein